MWFDGEVMPGGCGLIVTQVCYDLFCFRIHLSLVLHLCPRSIVVVHLLPKQVVRVRSSSWALSMGWLQQVSVVHHGACQVVVMLQA